MHSGATRSPIGVSICAVDGATGPPDATLRSRWLALSRPPFVIAVAALATNDAVLKTTVPGWWTGKLSDLAGVYIVAVLLGLATRRPWTADVLTAAAFAALKLSPAVAALAAPLLGGTTRTDPTDLLALVALVPAHQFVTRHVRPRTDGHPWQIPLTAAAITLTVLSTSATSCTDPEVGITTIVSDGDDVLALTRPQVHRIEALQEREEATEATHGPETSSPTTDRRNTVEAFRSSDGGTTWERSRVAADDVEIPAAAEVACRSDGTCFRTRKGAEGPTGSVSTRAAGGSWTTSWALTAEDVRRIELQVARCGRHNVGGAFFSTVAVVDGPGGEHVLVAMGHEGVVHLGPERSTWDRVGVGPHQPASLLFPSWFDALGSYAIAVLCLGLAATLLRLTLRWRTHAVTTGLAVVALGTALVLALISTVVFGDDYRYEGTVVACLTLGAVALSVAVARRSDAERSDAAARRSASPPSGPFGPW